MGTLQNAKQSENAEKNTRFFRILASSIFIVLLIILFVSISLLILSLVSIIYVPWPKNISVFLLVLFVLAILGIALSLRLRLLPIFLVEPQSSLAPSPVPPINITVTVPPIAPIPSYRGIVGLHPPTDPRSIQQRGNDVRNLYAALIQPDTTAIALTGIAGVGKSTLAALVYQFAEEQRLASRGPFTASALWLRIDSDVTLTDILGTLCKESDIPMPDISILSPQNQAVVFFNFLNRADKARLIVLDQFDNLLDPQTGYALPDRPGVGEWLDVINSLASSSRILLTSRLRPQGTRDFPLTFMQVYPTNALTEAEGIELLRIQGVQGTDRELREAVKRSDGHPLALALLASLLNKRNLSLTTLLIDPVYSQLWSGNVASTLLDYIYTQQLDQVQRKLLSTFSVFREAVSLQTILAIFDESIDVSEQQIISGLGTLLAQHLLQAVGDGRYRLHEIVSNYAQSHFAEGDKLANQQAMREAHIKAAQYYLQHAVTSCPPREDRRQISDVQPLIEAVWHYCQAAQQQEAYALIQKEGLFPDLEQWGAIAILLELCRLLSPEDIWQPKQEQAALIYTYLARAFNVLGQKDQALENYQQALEIYRKIPNHIEEGNILDNLGTVYADLEQMKKALDFYQMALYIQQKEGGNRPGEGRTLNNLGTVYKEIGQNQKALDYYLLALDIHRQVGDRIGKAVTLNNLGMVSMNLSKIREALNYYREARNIFQEEGDRLNEGITLFNIGALFLKQQQYQVSLAALLIAQQIFEVIQSPHIERVQAGIETLRKEVGEKQFDALLAQAQPQAQQVVEQVLSHPNSQEGQPNTFGSESNNSIRTTEREIDTLPVHLDRPAQVDALGRKAFAEALALRIRGMQNVVNKAPAFMLHIHGSWGSGKTSLLNFLREELEHGDEHAQWVVVNFNAWMHQRLGSPWWWLMNAVFHQSARRLWKIDRWRSVKLWGREFRWRFLRAGWPPYLLTLLVLALVLWLIRLNSFFGLLDFGQNQSVVESGKIVLAPYADFARSASTIIALIITIWGILFGLSRSLLQGTARTAKILLESTHDPMKVITDHFKDIVNSVGYPVVIFIDDLDRCQGSFIVELLEGIQTLFIEASVTYVIAADQRWISASYDKAYEAFASTFQEPGRPLGFLFLEKAFQISTSVPPMPMTIQAEYWQHLLQTNQIEYHEKLKEAQTDADQRLQEKYTEKEILDEVSRISNRGNVIEELAIRQAAVRRLAAPEVEARTEHSLKAFASLLEPNPRSMKRLVNTYGIQRAIATLAGVDIEMEQLALWTIVVLRWPLLADFLMHHPEMVRIIAEYATVREKLPDSIPEPLHKLFEAQNVRDIVRGKGIGSSLNEDVLRACAYLHTSDDI